MAVVEFNNGTKWITLATIDYVAQSILHGCVSNDYSNNLLVGDHIKFDTILFQKTSDIILDSSTTYNSNQNTASLGRIALLSGRTYKLTGFAANVDLTSISGVSWYNSDSNTALGITSSIIKTYLNTSQVSGNGAIAYVTPTSNIKVELRIVYASLSNVRGNTNPTGPAWFTVETII